MCTTACGRGSAQPQDVDTGLFGWWRGPMSERKVVSVVSKVV